MTVTQMGNNFLFYKELIIFHKHLDPDLSSDFLIQLRFWLFTHMKDTIPSEKIYRKLLASIKEMTMIIGLLSSHHHHFWASLVFRKTKGSKVPE